MSKGLVLPDMSCLHGVCRIPQPSQPRLNDTDSSEFFFLLFSSNDYFCHILEILVQICILFYETANDGVEISLFITIPTSIIQFYLSFKAISRSLDFVFPHLYHCPCIEFAVVEGGLAADLGLLRLNVVWILILSFVRCIL